MKRLIAILAFLSSSSFSQDFKAHNHAGEVSYHGHPSSLPYVGEIQNSNIVSAEKVAQSVYEESARRYAQMPRRSLAEINDSIQHLSQAKVMFKEQVARRNSLRQSIRGTEYEVEKGRVLDAATSSIHVARDYLFAKDYESAAIVSNITDTLLDFVTAFTPGVSWARDLYEAFSGIDLITGEELGNFSRSMAIMGAVTFGFSSKASRAVDVFEKLTKTPIPKVRKLLYEKPISELKETIGFFKRHKIWGGKTDERAVRFTNTFMEGAKTRITDTDMIVYRYYDPSFSKARGAWVTPKPLENYMDDLALLDGVYEIHKWTIPKGTEILEGIAAPLNRRMGGAKQIVVDPGVLQ